MFFRKSSRVIVTLSGGLGNQMFQYANALLEAKELNSQVLIEDYILRDYIYSSYYTKRKFELDIFDNSYNFLVPDILPFLPKRGHLYRWLGATRKLFFRIQNYLNPSRYTLKELSGSFQNNSNLEHSSEFLSQYFKINSPSVLKKISGSNKEILERISNVNSVSIHVRRGDYLTERNSLTHSICGIDYYSKAQNIIKSEFNSLEFFVFSDDIEWCKNNLLGDMPLTFVETASPHLDFLFMSKCKHNIIANSTFSWWAAYLNDSKEKKVIYPIDWFKVSDESVYFPEGWVGLKS